MKLSKYTLFVFLFAGLINTATGQNGSSSYYLFPIKPGKRNYLAGTMGELRSTHFHAGLDIKTDGVEGLPIYATADGHISRIKVSSGGYGNALYMLHPNGTTSVYAHLSKYQEDVADYIRKEQYKKESFSIELFPAPGQFKFKRGDIIAYSGNSGSSSGPHLHFEIRDEHQQVINPLRYGFSEITDNTPPSVSKVALVPMDINSRVNKAFKREEFTPVRNGSKYSISRNISASGRIGIELLAYDRQDGSPNRNGVQVISMLVDDKLVFKQEIKRLSFSNTRDILALTNYEIMKKRGSRFNKLYIDDGNGLGFYRNIINKGIIGVQDGKKHLITIQLTDSHGNESQVNFAVTGEGLPSGNQVFTKIPPKKGKYEILNNTLVLSAKTKENQAPFATVYANRMKHKLTPSYYHNNEAIYLWNLKYALPDSVDICGDGLHFNFKAMVPSNSSFNFYDKTLNISFPKKALFDTLYLTSDYRLNPDSTMEFFDIGPKRVPLRKYATFTLKPKLTYKDKMRYKAYLVRGKNYYSYQGGNWGKGSFTVRTRDFGTYTLLKDSIPPTINPVRISTSQIRMKIDDKLSGIKSFRLTIDGAWVLMNYDYKRKLLWSEKLDPSIPFNGEMVLSVTDNSGNENVYRKKIK